MGEPKPLASLSSTLLARKGHAKPAMRPQGFASFGYGTQQLQDDLGWNDMGDGGQPYSAEIVPIVPPVAAVEQVHAEPAPVEAPAVVRQQEALERELAEPAPAAVAPIVAPALPVMARAAPGSKAKAAFTLRLDPERHLRLRLACAVAHRSAQAMVVEALDAFLDRQAPAVEAAQAAAAKVAK